MSNIARFIDGNKMSEESQAVINQTREEIMQMKKRVVQTGRDMEDVAKIVKREELNVSFVLLLQTTEGLNSICEVLVLLLLLPLPISINLRYALISCPLICS
jgi:hypothetical protein